MVNTNVQGVIPIDGRGFTAKLKRNYQPGEYRKLSNIQLLDGIIKPRNNVRHYLDGAANSTPMLNAYPILGVVDDRVFLASETIQWSYRPGTRTVLWAPTSLPKNAHVDSFHKIIGVFEYNERIYWLTWEYNGTTQTSSFRLYHAALTTFTDIDAITFASLTSVLLFDIVGFGVNFNNFFVYKERLWVSTNKGLYFSKATDPAVFAIPNGGFVKLRDQNINFSFPHGDTIYILCDASIHSYTYNTDPNVDSYLREVSNVIGGEHGTAHRDTAYMVNAQGIYSLSNNNVTLIKTDFEVGDSTPYSKLIAWEEYIILIRTSRASYTNVNNPFWPGPWDDFGHYQANPQLSVLNDTLSNVWFVNMDTGATHTLDFYDQHNGVITQPTDRGNVVDMIVNPNKDSLRRSSLAIMTNKWDGAIATDGKAHLYRMTDANDEFFLYDVIANSANNIVRQKPNIRINIDSYVPDGNEYLIKKFRSLELMGNFPYWDFEIAFAYDNKNLPALGAGQAVTISTNTLEASGEPRGHYPVRLPLNQRARAITLELRVRNPYVAIAAVGDFTTYDQLEISDIRTLWTYTGRGLEKRTPTSI